MVIQLLILGIDGGIAGGLLGFDLLFGSFDLVLLFDDFGWSED